MDNLVDIVDKRQKKRLILVNFMSISRDNTMFHKRAKGDLGEDIACRFLVKQGFSVTDRNYRKTWGEIDIIAVKDNTIHFIEVKSVTFWSFSNFNSHRPEDNVHGLKARHIRRMIETYYFERGLNYETGFQFHVICVFLNMQRRVARVKWIRNLVI